MRQIVLDTETTGLDWQKGDRIVEIGCVELINRRLTGRHFHVYINPQRDVPLEAVNIHGLTEEFLSDKPAFAAIADEFETFVRDADLIIHNAGFDVGFLDYELMLLNRPALRVQCGEIIDTLRMAKEQNPGKKASLDALCERFDIDNAHRTLHGALLDAELLAEVYLAMTRGQESLLIDFDDAPPRTAQERSEASRQRLPLKVIRPSKQERLAHEAILDDIEKSANGTCLWRQKTAVPEE